MQVDTHSIPDLFERALHQASDLVRDEVALARAEISEKISMMGKGATMMAFGALLVLPALVMVLMAIAAALVAHGMAPWLANLATGVGALVVGGAVAWTGANQFSSSRLKPRATIEELRRDQTAMREMA